ncbi:PAS domain-containing sensor histidine kinase [Methanobacterium spitsbergense]|uniref:histidine kinase n=1 Tax=Methanobacterium spitsbergense TaxID=2874285 RepID=A0A8T5UNR1_9EURY|nr:PAS domain S-box protein [Methanobacterium spitsbergense]MBZ2165448.1 PAS domain S-box protein [Methanobacterium spitsbergense]
MDDDKIELEKLRKKAEETVKKQYNHKINQSKDTDELFHELQVHQVELEMQNEELRQAQIKLEDSQRKYFDLYNFAPDGYFTLDKEGIILEVNLKGASLLGVERLNLNKTAFIQYIAPDNQNKFYHHLQKVLETRTNDTIDLKLIKKDNNIFYAHIETMYVPDGNGNFKEFRLAITDISDLKSTEMALKESEERYREIFYNNHTIMILIDPVNLNIIEANPAACNFYGYDYEKLLKMKISDINTLDLDSIEDKMQKTVSKQEHHFIFKHRLSNGTICDVDIHSGLIPYKGKNVLCSVIHDITAQKKAEKILEKRNARINQMLNIEINDHEKAEIKLGNLISKLEISNKELEQFAYVSSHDLKEPLRMITSFLQLLQRRYANDLDQDANDFINFAVEGAKRLDMMINDLLEYSRVGSKEREFKYIYSEKIVETVLTNLKTQIQDKNAIVTYDSLPIIYASEYQMVQLFQNLISNAIKYNNKIPKVHISAVKKDKEYVFSIKDNGIGIDKDHLERIFTIFQRLHTREEYDGTGIGLAISLRIIQQHRGKIWAESEPEKGSTFNLSIPIKTNNEIIKLQ